MRTPWRFLTDLVSRKPTDKTAGFVEDAQTLALEYRQVEPEILPSVSNAAESGFVPDASAAERVENLVSEILDVTPVTTHALESESQELLSSTAAPEEIKAVEAFHSADEQPEISAKPVVIEISSARRSSRKARVALAGPPRERRVGDDPEMLMDAAKHSLDAEMLALDNEIQMLRSELSKRLAVQNGYMKELLARYK